jgi:RHH-type proline utilization regulon transcriptional repressor/proline dehydrogenase/delta 1-pyrroline-5-carboxylate dehydrogenase
MLGEGRADHEGCAALPAGVSRRDRSDRPQRVVQGHQCVRRALDLGEVVRAASALRARQARARDGRTRAARAGACARSRRSHGIGFTIDAEEADRLELSLDVIAGAYSDASLEGWEGYGLAVQAYQKRAPYVIDFLADLARRTGRRIPVRLVKGAYWDSEVKRAQVDGQAGYPVFTRKPNTDVSYLANCASHARRRRMRSIRCSPRTTRTRSRRSIASRAVATRKSEFEFQKLHGMGDDLYAEVVPGRPPRRGRAACMRRWVRTRTCCLTWCAACSRTAPIPASSTAFTDESVAIEDLVRDPVETVDGFTEIPHPRIRCRAHLTAARRLTSPTNEDNSMGINLANDAQLRALAEQVNAAKAGDWRATPLVPGVDRGRCGHRGDQSGRSSRTGGHVACSRRRPTVEQALRNAVAAQPAWDAMPAASRATILEHAADLLEQRMPQYLALCTKEAGKTIPDGVAEVREAVDFLRYYAGQARKLFAHPEKLPGPTGESNELRMQGRGVFVCISPWNFPLADLRRADRGGAGRGQQRDRQAAEQTNLIGFAAVKLAARSRRAGSGVAVPAGRRCDRGCGAHVRPARRGRGLHWLDRHRARDQPRDGGTRCRDRRAHRGNRRAERADRRFVGVAGTVDQGCVVVRVHLGGPALLRRRACCSCRTTSPTRTIAMLAGAMAELQVGDPACCRPTSGPVIDHDALAMLEAHAKRMQGEAKPIAQATMGETTEHGSFFAPRAWEIDSIDRLHKEVFGPALHVVRWKGNELDKVIDAINATGYGLTLGIHSRIDETIDHIVSRGEGGQRLRQPQPDRRGGRRAAVRRPGIERHRPQGGRTALRAALRRRRRR